MIVLVLLVMMKILEYSSGLLLDTEQLKKDAKRKKRIPKIPRGLGVGRGMTTVDELSVSPASDCNSNNVDVSYASTTSDVEFIQDNCDYQWFVDYGYREVHHPSVLSSCYDELARDLDSQLAQVDMEDYSAQDILSTLPAMCCTELQSERQGEMFASVSGSLMVKFEFDSSISPHTSSQDESSMSLCQSEPLFSPVKEVPLLPPNYSVDSLDCEEQDLMVTCQANKHNYTIAFHGSTVMGDTSEYTDTGESMCSNEGVKKSSKMAASDAPTTTWSKLRKVPTRQRHRNKTVSLPDLAPKLSSSLALGGCVKLFDIQNSSSVTSESFSGSAENRASFSNQKHGNFSLLRLFIAQRNNAENTNDNSKRGKTVRNTNELNSLTNTAWMDDLSACYEDSLVRGNSATEPEPESSSVERLSSKSISICSCSMSASSNKFNINNNNSFEHDVQKHNVKVGTQTSGSDLSDITSSSEHTNTRVPAHLSGRCPVHCVDRSMQTSTLKPIIERNKEQEDVEEGKKPVYVLYPNYTLPDLGFLRHNCLDLDKVLLAPLKYTGPNTPQTPPVNQTPYRNVTKQDVDMLKQKGLSHVLDWSSLTPLLPSEYWSILAELPQVKQHSTARFENMRPQFCITPSQNKEFTPFPDGRTNVNTSGCSTGTAPSSGYRGSSTLLTESGGNAANPLYVYNYSSEEKSKSKNKQIEPHENKRFSMFELGQVENNEEMDTARKRKSLLSQCNHTHAAANIKDTLEKEVWEDWWHDTKQRPNSPPFTHALRLDQLIELSGSDQWQPEDIQSLRDQVSKFLSEAGRKCVSFADKGDQQLTPPNSPTCQKSYQCKHPGLGALHVFPEDTRRSRLDISDKKSLVDGVIAAVEKIMASKEDNISQVVLDTLCPSLYALLSDELKHQLETPFGPIGNSVWQVVEASAQQGLMTKALNDLVTKLNSEDVLSEGLIKFNAFVFGLLNVRGVDAWVSYIRTRESVMTKHYTEEGLLLAASKGHAKSRMLTDQLIKALKPLAQCDFSLDLLYETRQLHQSLLQLTRLPLSPNQNIEVNTDSLLLRKIVQSIRNGLGNYSNEESQISEGKCRPRSCIDAVGGTDLASTVRKRWSGVQAGSRLANAFDKLQSDEEYSDSLDAGIRTSSSDELIERERIEVTPEKEGERGGKFRSLQRKWELLSGKTNKSPDLSPVKSSTSPTVPKSRIPRPVTSPVRPQSSRLPTPIQSKIPTPNSARPRFESGLKAPRPSRADTPQEKVVTSRPSSLPYRPPGGARVERRAASSSTARKSTNPSGNRHVVTLTHRLPSDSGHLAFNEGEKLRLVLEVDDTWLLCCRGDQKGLVPRSAVI